MPTYEYRCTACSNAFEKFQRITDGNPDCPQCHGKARRLLSGGSGNIIAGATFKPPCESGACSVPMAGGGCGMPGMGGCGFPGMGGCG